MVMVGVPDINIFPPVVVPIADDFPALTITALDVVLSVVMFWASVISPINDSAKIVPVAVKPVLAPTVSMVKPSLASVKLTLPSFVALLPPAIVVIVFAVLFKVKVPVPFKLKLVAVNAAVCVTAPEAVKLIVLFVAVKAELIARAPPNNEIGPATVTGLSSVMFDVLVVLPSLKLEGAKSGLMEKRFPDVRSL